MREYDMIRLYEKLYYSIIGEYCYLTNKSGTKQGLFSNNVSIIIDYLNKIKCTTIEDIIVDLGISKNSESENSLRRVLNDLSSAGFFSSAPNEVMYHSMDPKIREHLNKVFLLKPVPLTVDFEITAKCNLRCVHCYNSCTKDDVFLPLERFREIIQELKSLGTLFVGLSGGEPLLHPCIKQMVEICDEEGMLVTVLTNGTLLSDDIISFFKERSVQALKISYYSSDRSEHDAITSIIGSHNRTKENIVKYKAQIPLVLQCPVMHTNRNAISNLRDWAKQNGVPINFSLSIVAKADLSGSNLGVRLSMSDYKRCREELGLTKAKDYYHEGDNRQLCFGGLSSLAISVTGDCYICPILKMKLNSSNESISSTWQSSPILNKIRALKRNDFIQCVDCEHKKTCRVCLAENYNETGDLYSIPEFTCKKRID